MSGRQEFDADSFYAAIEAASPSPEPNPTCPACRELKARESALEFMVRVLSHMVNGHPVVQSKK